MAINFLNKVDFNQNELDKARIVNEVNNTAAGTGVEGQLFFDTTEDALKIWANGAWTEVGATSGVETFTNTNVGSTYVDFSVVNASAIGDVSIGFADLNAIDGTSTAADRFLTKANKWATIPFGDITEVQGGTYINVTNQTGPIPIVNHDLTTRPADSTNGDASPGYGGTFTMIDSVTTNSTGHVTLANLKTITLPANTNETYTLPVAAGASNSAIINLTAGGTGSGVKSSVTFLGTTGRIAITETVGNNGNITVDFPDDVIIVDDLTVGGVITQTQTLETNSFASDLNMNNNKLLNVKTGTAATDGVNLGQVELLVAGVGVFQGGYNATTGLTVPGGGELDGTSNIALDKGDYFVVTTAGTAFFGLSLEPGDFIFAETAIAANSNPPVGDYIVVRADDNVAGAGATDGATQKGVSGFDSANFDVSVNGWVQLNSQRNPYGASQTLDNTSPVVRVESGGLTTFTIDLADATLFGAGALAKNVTAEVTQNVSPYQTVYADVTRSGTASMSIVFSGSVAVDLYRVLLSHV